jgi:DNA-binding transcriptional regulator PaaX
MLFRKTDHFGRLRMSQKAFADELGIANETVCRALSKMAKEGRLKRIKSEKNNIGVYHIIDPDKWAADQEEPFVPGEG